jgi:hypothetical protein
MCVCPRGGFELQFYVGISQPTRERIKQKRLSKILKASDFWDSLTEGLDVNEG